MDFTFLVHLQLPDSHARTPLSRAVSIIQEDKHTGLKVTPQDLFSCFQDLMDQNLKITEERELEMRHDYEDLHSRHVELKRKFRTLYLAYRWVYVPCT